MSILLYIICTGKIAAYEQIHFVYTKLSFSVVKDFNRDKKSIADVKIIKRL